MERGDRYFYTGDMANISDFGIITAIYQDKWGSFADGKLNDGREQKRLYVSMFSKGPGQRFIPIEQYEEDRKEQTKIIREFHDRYCNA